jgi:class 3 adenylate cyclase
MQVLGDYYRVLGSIVTRFEATVTNFSADGLMVLVNAPLPCAEPALRAVEMAIRMQEDIQSLICTWRARGYAIGFGVGIAMGWATVGRVGYEGRHDYTAIGNVVNLAFRLCSIADDRQILVDFAIVQAAGGRLPLVALGPRHLKGYDKETSVYNVVWHAETSEAFEVPVAARRP